MLFDTKRGIPVVDLFAGQRGQIGDRVADATLFRSGRNDGNASDGLQCNPKGSDSRSMDSIVVS